MSNILVRPAAGPALLAVVGPPEPGVQLTDRRWSSDQALASARIEGHTPTPEFLDDVAAVLAGTMTADELRAASLARATAADSIKTSQGSGSDGT